MSKISLQMYTMREHTKTPADFEATVERLAAIGFQNLQYSIPGFMTPEQVRTVFDKYGIRNDSIFSRIHDIRANLPAILHQADVLDTRWLRLDSMPAALSPSVVTMYAHYLNELGDLLLPHGIRMMYHFHSFEFLNFQTGTALDLFLAETDPEKVFIQPDTHWIAAGGVSPVDFLTRYRNRVHYVHVKDFSIGLRDGILESTPARFAPVGSGNLNWRAILDVCESFHNEMYVIEQDNCYNRDAFDCVTDSFRFLKSMGID